MRNQWSVELGDFSDNEEKVDLIFSYGKIELFNIEFKRQDISPKDITVQCRKNIRLGRCIQELHRSYGIKDPFVMMGDVAGCVGFFYSVKPFKEISVAGKTTRSMAILLKKRIVWNGKAQRRRKQESAPMLSEEWPAWNSSFTYNKQNHSSQQPLTKKTTEAKGGRKQEDNNAGYPSDENDERLKLLEEELSQKSLALFDKNEQLKDLQQKVQDLQQRLESSEQQGDHHPSSASNSRVEETIFSKRDYVVLNVDIGELFVDFQRRSTRLVNKAKEKAKVDSINSFMAMNYVLDLEGGLPGLSSRVLDAIKREIELIPVLLSPDDEALCDDLDKELKMTGKVASRDSVGSFEDDILFIY
ncbi:hypothetical protein BGZ99_004507 [Dissophora globulifera]|uniref:Uncharacterized protein n=1 Tax=Dissophora globulifera TaxID=979702 RepID=A0A9P6RLW9_9FUNG|nr:hypothetical protein BGZ99_004507 [Dissophora globulifera]